MALYGPNQSPIVAIVTPLYTFEVAQTGPFLDANLHFSPCKRAISNNKDAKQLIKNVVSDIMVLI